jgi:hypothetical protein
LVAALGIHPATLWLLFALRQSLLEDREVKTRKLVEAAITLVGHCCDLARSGQVDQATAQKQAAQAVKAGRALWR